MTGPSVPATPERTPMNLRLKAMRMVMRSFMLAVAGTVSKALCFADERFITHIEELNRRDV
jgi:hypothetical protein